MEESFRARPVVITFDDGNLDIYQNAFPIMHELGFVGTTYIVANRLQSKYFVNVEQIQEMADDGWEIGSHSMTHTDLTTDYSIANFEMRQSMLTLEDATGEPVSSFAYPYGKTDEFITNKVSEYGYQLGMGLGSSYQHSLGHAVLSEPDGNTGRLRYVQICLHVTLVWELIVSKLSQVNPI